MPPSLAPLPRNTQGPNSTRNRMFQLATERRVAAARLVQTAENPNQQENRDRHTEKP